MSDLRTLTDLVNMFPRRVDLVADMNRITPGLRVTLHQVNKWAEKGSLPAKYHFALLEAARERAFPVTAEMLVRWHARDDRSAA